MRARLVLAASVLLAFVPFVGADDAASAPQALRTASQRLRDGDWAGGATALKGVRTSFPGTPEATEAWVLEARALLVAGRPREALAETAEFLKATPGDAWAGRVASIAADAYGALGQDADRARTLGERAVATTGVEARARVAALYVHLGDDDFDGREGKDDLGRPVKRKDFAKAVDAYRRALAIGVAAADVLRVRTRLAQALEETRDFAGAETVWAALVEEAAKTAGADPETWLVGRARARLRLGKRDEARKDLREALETYPRGARRLETLRLLAEERFAAAGGPDGDVALEEGVAYLRRAMTEFRDDAQAADVHRTLAEAYATRGKWEKAATEWNALLERFPTNASAPEWRHALASALLAAEKHDEAVAQWRTFLGAHPNHPLWQTVQASIPNAKFAKGVARAAAGDVDGAVTAFRAFAEEFPTDPRAPQALLAVGALLRERKDFEGAIAAWRGVQGRYAASAEGPQAWLLVAQTLEDDLHRLEEAVKEYEGLVAKHAGTPSAQEASARLERLRAKHLEVRGERVVGTSEGATLHVTTRNMPTLEVRVFALDVEDYFRRKHTVLGVENLQMEIVKPDATAEWKVDPYAPYALVEADRAVPVKGPGAYVVVAGDADLTSTTLLLVSDVDVIVKSSAGRQVLAWARDRASGAPVAGARVLVSDGSTVFEGTTGADGVFAQDLRPDQRATRVLLLHGRQPASTEVDPGSHLSEGWSTKVHLSTDRPVYRPGHVVHWRGLFRRASGGGYTIPGGAKGRASVLDPRGSVVEEREVVASATGVFEGETTLDGTAPLGTWNVRVDVDGLSFTGPFEVLEYRKPEFTLEVDPAKPSYATGEEVKATIRLRYVFGSPVVDAPVEWSVVRVPNDFTPSAVNDYSWYYQDPDALQRARDAARQAPRGALVARGTARTDDRGEATVTFPTTERDEDAEYVVSASAVDVTRRFVASEGRIPVVRRDHAAVVTTDARVYRPKQEIRATVVTVDALQSPVARSGKVVLARVRRTAVPVPPAEDVRRGGRGLAPNDARFLEVREEEIEVQTLPVTTDAKGRAEVRLVPPDAGTYRVRWNATDARGALVTAFATVDVAGAAEDLTKDARLVAAKQAYVEGETAEVLLQSPVTRTTALLTFEGEKVLAWRLVKVDGPSAVLEVPLDAAYAPNVFVKIAIPAADRLVEADTEIVVLRYLAVSVAPKRATAAPGEEVTFDVTTTDAAGKPVAAEVGLAIVDEALLGIARDKAPAIRPFFYDRKRTNRVVTSSSVGFKTYGTTRETNKDLLATAEAREGDAGRFEAQASLRLAREALRRKDADGAVRYALAAVEADPSSWDARALLGEMRTRADTKEAYDRHAQPAERAMQDLLRRETERAKDKDARFHGPGGAPPPPAASPRPMGESGADDEKNDSGVAYDSLEEAEFEGPAKNGAIGIGGGAGGTFKGRGGSRNLRASGGGGKKLESGQGASGFLLFAGDGDHGPTPILGGITLDTLSKSAATLGLGNAGGLFDAPPVEVALRKTFADTAQWSPHVATDAAGRASVTVKLPDNLTTWRATARGASGAALFGEGRGSVVSRRDVLLRVDAPRFLVQGDRVTVPSAVHNGSSSEITTLVRMKVEGATLSGDDGTLVVPAGGRAIRDREIGVSEPRGVRIEAEATSSAGGDRVEVGVPALPRGIRSIDGRSGRLTTAGGDTQDTFLEVPEGSIAAATRLVVSLAPGIDTTIADALVGLDLFPYGCVEQTVHRALPAAWARAALADIGSPEAMRLEDVTEALRRTAGRLAHLANDDGSFGWWRGGTIDVRMTSLAILLLREAESVGVASARATMDRAAQAIRRVLRAASDDDQALGHWALAAAGRLDDEAYAVTFRRRNEELSAPGLSWMTLAALAAGRAYDAEELSRILLARRVDEGDRTRWTGRTNDCFTHSDRLATALAVRALIEAGAASEAVERGMRWLVAAREKPGETTIETAAFVGAAASYVRRARPARFGGTVALAIDGKVVRTVTVPARAALAAKDRRLALDATDLAPGRHTLSFRLEGSGELFWAARLETVQASETLPADEHGLRLDRLYLEAEVALPEGSEMPPKPGYTILREGARPKVEAKSLEHAVTGDRVLVRLSIVAPRDLQYVMIEDPLPAGFEVLDGTAAGPFDWQERRDDRQVFFVSNVKQGAVVLSYVLQAVHLGAFTALPTYAYPMYLPEVNARAAGHRLTIGDRGSASPGPEAEPTPDEVYAVARRAFDAKRWDEAAGLLTALREKYPLRDDVVEEIEAALLRCAIERKDAKEIVRAREELVRRAANRIPGDFDTAHAIAAAYVAVGGHPVAASLYADLVARGFGLERAWAQALAQRDRELEGLAALGDAVRGYPVSNATADAALTRALRFRELRRPAGTPGRAGAPMEEETLAALRSFVAHFAGTSFAAPGSYALVESLRRVKDLDGAVAEATAFPRRFPDSAFVDDVLYFLMDSHWRRFEAAPTAPGSAPVLASAQRLVDETFPTGSGTRTSSEFRARAYHTIARVRHVLGDLEGAIEAYRRASGEVEDAREALAYLTDRSLSLEETVRADVAGTASFPLKYRNVTEVRFKAYPVDLQVLFSVRRTLVGLNRIDLSGIVPAHEWTFTAKDGADHAWHEASVELPAGKDAAGVWLVVAKAGDLEASTIVLKTDLRVNLQTIGEKVRVHVVDATGRGVRDAYVTVSDGQSIRGRGKTDGRGVLEAPGVGATPFVVVNVGDRTAVAR